MENDMENVYERLSEILEEALRRAEIEAKHISSQYTIRSLGDINKVIVDKVDESLTKSPEKLKSLTELVISKLEKLLKLTGPNKVDNEILESIADYIKHEIRFDDPNYIEAVQKIGKSLDLLLHAHYALQSIYLRIVYGKFTPPGFYSYLDGVYEDIRKYNPNPDRGYIEFYLRETIALSCVKGTLYDLFKNPEKHKQLIEEDEDKYIDTILNEFCKKYY
jgi:hypothetical protein